MKTTLLTLAALLSLSSFAGAVEAVKGRKENSSGHSTGKSLNNTTGLDTGWTGVSHDADIKDAKKKKKTVGSIDAPVAGTHPQDNLQYKTKGDKLNSGSKPMIEK